MKRMTTAVLGASLLLAGCGQPSSAPPQGEVSEVPEAYRDQSGAAWTQQAQAGGLRTLALSTDLTSPNNWSQASNGWGPIEINRSNGEKAAGDGKPLTIGGKVYARGLGLHANADIYYVDVQAADQVCTFTAEVGIDDEVKDQGSAVFRVVSLASGSTLYTSGVLRGSDPAAKQVSFEFLSGGTLLFEVSDGADSNYFDHVDIVNPQITCSTASKVTDTDFGRGGTATSVSGTPLGSLTDNSLILKDFTFGFSVTRLLPTGFSDNNYGNAGRLDLPYAQVAALYPDGRIVQAYKVDANLVVSRFLASGQPDTTFGTGGTITTNLPRYLVPKAIYPDSRGGVVIAQQNGVARFTSVGTIDQNFGDNGFLARITDPADQGYVVDIKALPNKRYGVFEFHNTGTGMNGEYTAYATLSILDAKGATLTSSQAGPTRFFTVNNMTAWPDGSVAAATQTVSSTSVMEISPTFVTTRYGVGFNGVANIYAYGTDKLLAYDRSAPLLGYTRLGVRTPDFSNATSFVVGGVKNVVPQPNGGLILVRNNTLERIVP